MTALPATAAAVLAGDRRAAARLITLAESGDPSIVPALQALWRAGRDVPRIGVTGPPGAGKSTLVDQVVAHHRARGRRVAVLAVDPSSPFSGGAVLGDRVRMNRHAGDAGVFLRSMATRGALGGLAHAAGDALTVLGAMDFDLILVETVGVGQSEVDILAHADVSVLLQTALGGDQIQLVKAGVLEIADILVVNKADAPGSDRMAANLADLVSGNAHGWRPPVLLTEATTGSGIDALCDAVGDFRAWLDANPDAAGRRARRQIRARLTALAQAAVRARLQTGRDDARVEAAISAVIDRSSDPHAMAQAIFGPA